MYFTMIEAIEQAQAQGGAYIALIQGDWHVLSRTPKGRVKGVIYVSFDGSTFRV